MTGPPPSSSILKLSTPMTRSPRSTPTAPRYASPAESNCARDRELIERCTGQHQARGIRLRCRRRNKGNRNRPQQCQGAWQFLFHDSTVPRAPRADPGLGQAYYRRAVANTAILKHNEALRDWKIVVKKNPGDKNAKLQHTECEKIVKRDAFLKAIEVADAPSAIEGLDLDSMVVEDSYDGVKLEGTKMTKEFIEDMIQRFKDGKKIHRKYVYQIIIAVKELVYNEPTMVEYDVPEGTKITVCGDTHGKLHC